MTNKGASTESEWVLNSNLFSVFIQGCKETFPRVKIKVDQHTGSENDLKTASSRKRMGEEEESREETKRRKEKRELSNLKYLSN